MRHGRVLATLVSVLIAASLACDIGVAPTPSVSPRAADVSDAPVGQPVTAAEGATLVLEDGASLQIPPDSLAEDVAVAFASAPLQDAPDLDRAREGVGQAYQIDLGDDPLDGPVTLEIPFDPAALPAGASADQVFLSTYDEDQDAWVYAGGIVDPERHVVRLEVTHASWWMPTTWNWSAWIAVLSNTLELSITDLVKSVQLLTTTCSQRGAIVSVDDKQARSLIQGCVDRDDPLLPELRVVNPKAFYYEVRSSSNGRAVIAPQLLSPGEDLTFAISTQDPSPLDVEVEITQAAGLRLVVHMVLTMLPGANQFGIQGRHVGCITERLNDVTALAQATEALTLDYDGVDAADALFEFLSDEDAMRRFVTAADDCEFGPARTWSLEGFKQITGAASTIMRATDYLANYLAGNSPARLSFTWTSLQPAQPAVAVSADGNQVSLGDQVLLDVAQESPGCFGVDDIRYAPTQDRFLVLLRCFEGDNEAYLFNADGSGKLRLTDTWDFINYSNAAWSRDGKFIAYERINSCCAEAPADAPPRGLVRYEIATGSKVVLVQDAALIPFEWSPNGVWIAYVQVADLSARDPVSSLFVVATDGLGLWRLDDALTYAECADVRWTWEEPDVSLRLYCLRSDGTRGPSYLIQASSGGPPSESAVAVDAPGAAQPGSLYRVVGVISPDTLNVRAGPNIRDSVVARIPANGTDIEITGESRTADGSVWVPIRWQGLTGWVNRKFLEPQPGSRAPASDSATRPTTPLDRQSTESVVAWVQEAFRTGDIAPFEALASAERVFYGNSIEGGQPKTISEFLEELSVRLASPPICNGYADPEALVEGSQLTIWTSGWSPAWQMTELCYSGCVPLQPAWTSPSAAILFDWTPAGWQLRWLWLGDLASWRQMMAYAEELKPCNQR